MDQLQDYLTTMWSQYWQLWLSISLVVACLVFIHNTEWFAREAVSKKKARERNRKVMERTQNTITEALEDQHRRGHLKRNEVDRMYDLMRKAGFREVGPEPSFGKPWYFGAEVMVKSAHAVKGAIMARLRRMNVDIPEKLHKIKLRRIRKSNKDIQNELRASFRKV